MSESPATTATANVVLDIGADRLQMSISAETGPAELQDVLPVARALVGKVIEIAVRDVEEAGARVSCKAGCGACCRQLVPIPEVEARMLVDLLNGMPEPRRGLIRQRFQAAKQKLEESGLWQKLKDRVNWKREDVEQVGLDYFAQGVPCPFLEDESCSIHPDRPITCREYLVTSPAEECAKPRRETIHTVPLAKKVWPALARFDGSAQNSDFLRWVPMIQILEWVDENPTPPAPRPGTELVQRFFEHLTGSKIPANIPGIGS